MCKNFFQITMRGGIKTLNALVPKSKILRRAAAFTVVLVTVLISGLLILPFIAHPPPSQWQYELHCSGIMREFYHELFTLDDPTFEAGDAGYLAILGRRRRECPVAPRAMRGEISYHFTGLRSFWGDELGIVLIEKGPFHRGRRHVLFSNDLTLLLDDSTWIKDARDHLLLLSQEQDWRRVILPIDDGTKNVSELKFEVIETAAPPRKISIKCFENAPGNKDQNGTETP